MRFFSENQVGGAAFASCALQNVRMLCGNVGAFLGIPQCLQIFLRALQKILRALRKIAEGVLGFLRFEEPQQNGVKQFPERRAKLCTRNL